MLSVPARFLGTPKRSSIFPSGCKKAQIGFFKCGQTHHDMLLASMLGSPQGGSGVSSSALQRQIAHATCAYGFHCQFKDSSMVVPTKQCECGNRFPHPVLVVVILGCRNSSGQSCEHGSVQSGFLFASARWAKCRSGLSCQEYTRKGVRIERREQKDSGQERYEGEQAIPAHACTRPLKFRSRPLNEPACSATATRRRPLPKSAAIWGQASTRIFSNTRTENFQSTR